MEKIWWPLKKVQARHYEVKNGVEGVSVILHKMSDEVKQLGILAAGYLGFEFLATQVTGILRGAGRLSDQLADVRRVAGLTALVDFTQRMAGLAKTANVTLDASIGLAAGLEESGQRAESSSTAIIKVLGAIGKDVEKFAKAAGKPVEEFSKPLRDKPIEALIQLSEGLVKNKKGNFFAKIASGGPEENRTPVQTHLP